ncbi:MAG: hypothetical protein LBH31_03115, partial [Burkholderiaceae bacterium]|nr:hypothetical protein [Burkholderiaceae bacterium]
GFEQVLRAEKATNVVVACGEFHHGCLFLWGKLPRLNKFVADIHKNNNLIIKTIPQTETCPPSQPAWMLGFEIFAE